MCMLCCAVCVGAAPYRGAFLRSGGANLILHYDKCRWSSPNHPK